MSGFDHVAGIYETLKALVFGSKLDHASYHFLSQIDVFDRVLILGGGSGKILQQLCHVKHITYLDSSAKMIKKAELIANENVAFLTQDFLDFEAHVPFDWVICPFFLDVFPENKLPNVVDKMSGLLSEGGLLIVTDFQPISMGHRLFIFTMYLFFNLTTQIRHFRIPRIRNVLDVNNFVEVNHSTFMNAFIFSSIYQLKRNPK